MMTGMMSDVENPFAMQVCNVGGDPLYILWTTVEPYSQCSSGPSTMRLLST